MRLDRLGCGEGIAAISAILLLVFMSFPWFHIEFFNAPDGAGLLYYLRGTLPESSAWEVLDYIPIVLLTAIIAALSAGALRLTIIAAPSVEAPRLASAARDFVVSTNAIVAVLGTVSVLLILYRILDPPDSGFGTSEQLGYEATVLFSIFPALLTAAGIAFGGCLALWREGVSLLELRLIRHRNQGAVHTEGR